MVRCKVAVASSVGSAKPKASSPARKLARIVYAMIATCQAYDENEAFKVTPSALHKRLQNLQEQAAALGLQLIPA